MAGGSQADTTARLQKDAIGLAQVLFQSITHMAPAAAVAFSIIFAVTYAGGATPLAVLLALIACLLVAISIGQLAKHLPSAGGLYTYSARGLHPAAGFFVAWGFMLAEPIVAPLLYLIFGNVIAVFLQNHFNTPMWLWAPFAAAAGIGVWFLVYRGIRISTEAGVILGAFEIVVFLALAITLIISAGSNNTLSVFNPNTGNSHGWGSVFAGMVYTVLAFIGFEASVPLAEETKDPRRTLPRAVILSCVLIGVFYLVCYYGAMVYFGPSVAADATKGFFVFNGGDPWDGLASKVWGPLSILVLLAIVNSAFANSNAGANAATRVGFALGRVGILPRALAQVHPRYKTPYIAVHIQGALGIAIALILGFALSGPLNAFALLGTVATLVIVLIYILTNLSNLVFYIRQKRDELNPILNVVVPILGTLIFIPVLLAAFGIDFGGLGIAGLTAPANAAPWIVLAWLVFGVVVFVLYTVRSPGKIQETARTFIEG
ncbi:MAG TPA: APC family permease [Candidatus Dormibacteraeota bacterium]|jgi:amino acid transporter|nr:APC family permease [Candidatus Dormibacteraeota bacterium]